MLDFRSAPKTQILYMTIQWTFMYSLALIIFVVSEKKAFEHFPIGSNVNQCIAVAAILDGGQGHLTQFWKLTT